MSEISSGVPPQASAAVVDSAQCIYQLGILLGIGRFDTYEEVQSTWSEVGIYRTFTLVDQYREQSRIACGGTPEEISDTQRYKF